MSWSKLKNIIILVLVTVNLMLAALALYYWQRETADRRSAMENAVEILEKQGVTVQTEWGEMSLPVMEVQRDQRREEVLAAALLGTVIQENRGAGVYRYSNSRGAVQFHSNGEFSATFSAGSFPVGGAQYEEHALEILELLDFQGEVVAVEQEDGTAAVTVRQVYNGAPLLFCQAVLTYEEGCLTAISQGRRLNGTPYAAAQEADPISAPSALIRFLDGLRTLGDVCNTVTAVEESYRLSTTFSGPVVLTPVWYITTDTGSYQLDGLTGELADSAG